MRTQVSNHSLLKKTIIVVSFLINIAALLLISFLLSPWVYWAIAGTSFVFFAVLLIANRFVHDKFLFLITYSVLPIFGIVMYVFGKRNNRHLKARKEYQDLEFRNEEEDDTAALENFEKTNFSQYNLVRYFSQYFKKPLFQNSVTKFLDGGEKYFNEVFENIKQAKKYIFIQTYVIDEGVIWKQLFEMLKEKVRQGVEVKLLYDPLGCKKSFKDKLTFKKLENYKIAAMPFRAGAFGHDNHRKLIVVDGVVGFLGGANISDKYNEHSDMSVDWEVSGIKVSGDAVWSMTTRFLNDWQFSKGKLNSDFINYMPERMTKLKSTEFVQPISLSPITNKNELKNFWLAIINNTKEQLDIVSSYINIDDDVLSALKRASYSGVKVNIIVSSISDHDGNIAISRDFYRDLMRAGVNILEYQNCFVRSKIIMIDNSICFVGTPALDLRVLNLRYENGVLFNGKENLREVSKYLETVKFKCKLMTFKEVQSRPFTHKIYGWINRIFRFR